MSRDRNNTEVQSRSSGPSTIVDQLDCITAPEDCTRSDQIGRLVSAGRRLIDGGARQIVLDLVTLRTMNSQLLSAVIYLGQECLRGGVAFRLVNIPTEFDAWATSHRLTELPAMLRVRTAEAMACRIAR